MQLKVDAAFVKAQELKRQLKFSEDIKRLRSFLNDKGKEMLQQAQRLERGTNGPALRCFTAQLHFCSLKAYSLIRRYWRLPATATIRWMLAVDCVLRTAIAKICEISANTTKSKLVFDLWIGEEC